MDKKYFKLNVPIGTRIISSRGNYTIEEIPENAFEFFYKGSDWISLLPEAVEVLAKMPQIRLKGMLHLKEKQGKEDDVKILSQALEMALSQDANRDTPTANSEPKTAKKRAKNERPKA